MLDSSRIPWYDVITMEVNDGLSLSSFCWLSEKNLHPFCFLRLRNVKTQKNLSLRDHDTFDKQYCGGWLFRWDDIKWYDSYEGIAAIEKFIMEATSDEYQFEVDGVIQNSSEYIRFVRVGEDTNDIEMHGDGFWDIHVSRHIEC